MWECCVTAGLSPAGCHPDPIGLRACETSQVKWSNEGCVFREDKGDIRAVKYTDQTAVNGKLSNIENTDFSINFRVFPQLVRLFRLLVGQNKTFKHVTLGSGILSWAFDNISTWFYWLNDQLIYWRNSQQINCQWKPLVNCYLQFQFWSFCVVFSLSKGLVCPF